MLNILVPVDGSDYANRAVLYARELAQGAGAAHIHLLNVQTPVQGRAGLSRLITQDMIDEFYAREGEEAMEEARKLLDVTGTAYTRHVAFGHVASEIAGYAQASQNARSQMELIADQIVQLRSGLQNVRAGNVS